MTPVMIAVGAAIGAPARYLLDRAIQSRHSAVFPWGTVSVNLLACFVLGLVTGASSRLDPRLTALLATGLCGALSTYSTFGYETLRLLELRRAGAAAANVLISLAGGLGLAAAGWALGAAMT